MSSKTTNPPTHVGSGDLLEFRRLQLVQAQAQLALETAEQQLMTAYQMAPGDAFHPTTGLIDRSAKKKKP